MHQPDDVAEKHAEFLRWDVLDHRRGEDQIGLCRRCALQSLLTDDQKSRLAPGDDLAVDHSQAIAIETVDDIEAEIAAAIQIFDEMLADAQAAATVFDAHHVAPQIAGSEPVKFLSAAFAEIGRIEQGGAER